MYFANYIKKNVDFIEKLLEDKCNDDFKLFFISPSTHLRPKYVVLKLISFVHTVIKYLEDNLKFTSSNISDLEEPIQ